MFALRRLDAPTHGSANIPVVPPVRLLKGRGARLIWRPRIIAVIAVAALGGLLAGCGHKPMPPQALDKTLPTPGRSGRSWILSTALPGVERTVGVPAVIDGIALWGLATPGTSVFGSQATDVRTGRVLWRQVSRSDVHTSPRPVGLASAGGPMSVGIEAYGDRIALVGREARTGTVRWWHALPSGHDLGGAVSGPVACGRAVCQLVANGKTTRLEAYYPGSGKTVWSSVIDSSAVYMGTADDTRVVTFDGSVMRAYSTSTGASLWASRPPGGTPQLPLGVAYGAYVYRLGNVLVGENDAGVFGLDLATGKRLWSRPHWWLAGRGQPTVGGDGLDLAAGHVLVVGSANTRVEHDLASIDARSGRQLWTVVDSHFNVFFSSDLAWSADLTSVWALDGSASPHGHSLTSGASLTTPPRALWTPLINARRNVGSGELGNSVAWDPPATIVDATLANGLVWPIGSQPSPPSWAGPVDRSTLLRTTVLGDQIGSPAPKPG